MNAVNHRPNLNSHSSSWLGAGDLCSIGRVTEWEVVMVRRGCLYSAGCRQCNDKPGSCGPVIKMPGESSSGAFRNSRNSNCKALATQSYFPWQHSSCSQMFHWTYADQKIYMHMYVSAAGSKTLFHRFFTASKHDSYSAAILPSLHDRRGLWFWTLLKGLLASMAGPCSDFVMHCKWPLGCCRLKHIQCRSKEELITSVVYY